MQVNKNAYMVNGNKNWSLLRKQVFIVQENSKKNLGGRIPGKQDIENILEKAVADKEDGESDTSFHSRVKQHCKRRRHENPAKSSLERLGVEFPSGKFSSCSTDSINKQILCSAPSTEEEEEEQLKIVIRESLHQQADTPITSQAQPQPQSEQDMYFPASRQSAAHDVGTGFDYAMLHGAHNIHMYRAMKAIPIAKNLPRENTLTSVWNYPVDIPNSAYPTDISQRSVNMQTSLYPPSTNLCPPAYQQGTAYMERVIPLASMPILPASYSTSIPGNNNTNRDDTEDTASILLSLASQQNQDLEN